MARKRTAEELAAEQAAAEAELAAFQSGLPLRMLRMAAQAQALGISYRIVQADITDPGPTLRLDGGEFFDREEIGMESEPWEVEHVEHLFKQEIDERERQRAVAELARAALKKLSPEEIAALKENGDLIK